MDTGEILSFACFLPEAGKLHGSPCSRSFSAVDMKDIDTKGKLLMVYGTSRP